MDLQCGAHPMKMHPQILLSEDLIIVLIKWSVLQWNNTYLGKIRGYVMIDH